jgi:hypothetical protein
MKPNTYIFIFLIPIQHGVMDKTILWLDDPFLLF